MGGGDLNLKKSWHPSTLKNQERVWKAEQEKQKEDKKIAELQQELKEERLREQLEQTGIQSGKLKKNENSELNWMYKGPGSHVSREEYLLGRKIDKAFDMLQKEEIQENQNQDQSNKSSYTVEHEINPESVIQKDENNVQVDMKRKLMEDPLLLIRQNEEATKRAITSNPVKMKQLQLLISSLKEKKKKKKHKEDSKSKKKKLKEKKKKKGKSKKKKKKDSSDSESLTESEILKGDQLSMEERAKRRKKVKRLIDKEVKRAAERRESKEARRRRSRSRSRSRSFERRERRLEDFKGRESRRGREEKNDWREKERVGNSSSRSHESKKWKSDESNVEEEMRRKREDMKKNASQRDKQRRENVEKYREELKREEDNEAKTNSQKFVKKLGSASVVSSVESRIRSKVGSLQKGISHMDSNFLRK